MRGLICKEYSSEKPHREHLVRTSRSEFHAMATWRQDLAEKVNVVVATTTVKENFWSQLDDWADVAWVVRQNNVEVE